MCCVCVGVRAKHDSPHHHDGTAQAGSTLNTAPFAYLVQQKQTNVSSPPPIRKQYKRILSSVVTIQKNYRAHFWRRAFLRLRLAAVVLQKHRRGQLARSLCRKLQEEKQKQEEEERKRREEKERRRLEEEERRRMEERKQQEEQERRKKEQEERRLREEEEQRLIREKEEQKLAAKEDQMR